MAVYRLWDTVLLAKPNLSVFHTQPGVVLTEMNLTVGGADRFKNVKTDDGNVYDTHVCYHGTNHTSRSYSPSKLQPLAVHPRGSLSQGQVSVV